MYKVVINRCYGGFSLSRKAVLRARKLSGNPNWGGPTIKGDIFADGIPVTWDYGYLDDIARHDPILVKVVEELGNNASGTCAELCVVEISSRMYRIDNYDGWETLNTPDTYDYVIIE